MPDSFTSYRNEFTEVPEASHNRSDSVAAVTREADKLLAREVERAQDRPLPVPSPLQHAVVFSLHAWAHVELVRVVQKQHLAFLASVNVARPVRASPFSTAAQELALELQP